MDISDLTAKQVAHMRSLDYVRWVKMVHECDGRDGEAAYRFTQRYPQSPHLDLIRKAVSAVGTTTDSSYAGPIAAFQPFKSGLLSFVRPATILGKVQDSLRLVPFNVSVASQTAGGTYTWVGQGSPKPVGTLAFSAVTLGIAKAAGLIVVADELVRVSSPAADIVVRDDMVTGIAAYLNTQFVDPSLAPVANVSPGSITNGVTPIVSAGTSAANATTDLKALVAAYYAANANPGVILMSPANATALAFALGLPDLTDTLYGNRLITSTALGTNIVMFDPAAILFADDDGLEITMSREGTVQMDSAPTDPPVAATVTVSLWQAGLVGFKVDRFLNWKRSRLSAVKYVSGAAYV